MINAKMIVYAFEGAITNRTRYNVISRVSACVAQLQINGNGKEADAYHEYPEARISHSAFGRLRLY